MFQQYTRRYVNIKNFARRNTRKVIIPLGVSVLTVAVVQAIKVRLDYKLGKKLDPPLGPNFGKFGDLRNRLLDLKENIIESVNFEDDDHILKKGLNHLKKLLASRLEKANRIETATSESDSNVTDRLTDTKLRRKIQLLVLGDSLVAGVGCDKINASPILPVFLAKILSVALNADVEWISSGKVGATVTSIRNNILPEIKDKVINSFEKIKSTTSLLNCHDSKSKELVVVVICGLNDWREMFERFPFGLGPVSFKEELGRLVEDIKDIGVIVNSPCKVFLPALPLLPSLSDPLCCFRLQPLYQIFSAICWLWDNQKRSVFLHQSVDIDVQIAKSGPDLGSDHRNWFKTDKEIYLTFSHFS